MKNSRRLKKGWSGKTDAIDKILLPFHLTEQKI